MSLVSMARTVGEIDRLQAQADHYRQQAEVFRAKYELVKVDCAELRFQLGELTRENDDLRDQLGRSEDRRYEP